MARRKKPTDDETNENLNKSNDSSDDTFGLPDIEYKPLDRVEEKTTVVETTTVYSSTESEPEKQHVVTEEYTQPVASEEPQPSEFAFEEEPSPVWPKVLGVLIVVLLAVGAAWYFVVYKPKAEKDRLAALASEREKNKQDSIRNANSKLEEARLAAEKRKADSLNAIPKAGIFETLTERTGRYYVVVASAVDDDLLVDHAKKLGEKGVSTKLIPPFRKYKFYRLTIADADTFASAQQIADSKKSEYTDALWVLKY